MSTYRLFPSTNGPSTPTSYGGDFVAGVTFTTTQPTTYLAGYYWWVCNTGQSTSAQSFTLWNTNENGNSLIAEATAASGVLTAGQWNYVALSTPIPLAENQVYVASTAFPGGFPETDNQFGSGQPYAAGITNGPLFSYSDTSGSAPTPGSILGQGLFATGTTDPTAYMPGQPFNSANFWIDVQITDIVPPNPSYRLFPSTPDPYYVTGTGSGTYTITTEFKLSQACTLQKLWYYSANGCTALPSQCGIFSVASQTEVSGSDNSSPSWLSSPGNAASAGSGWCYVDYSSANLTLPAGGYQTAVYAATGSDWYGFAQEYWTVGLGINGAGNGPLSAPSGADADSPGQCGVLTGSWGYPNIGSNGDNFWIDVEVVPATTPAGPTLTMVSLI